MKLDVRFGVVDLFLGGRVVIDAGFNFDKNQGGAVAGDDVDFADVAGEIADDDFVALIAEKAGGDVFTTAAEGGARFGTA